MKKFLLVALALLCMQGVRAQEQFGIFDHFGGGLSVGTDGIGIDVAAPITDMFAVRTGVSFLPAIKIKKNISINGDGEHDYYDNIDIEGKINKFDFKLLFDYYPIKSSSFHLTAGAFIGSSKVLKVKNTSPILKNEEDYGTAGLVEGPYRISTDEQGNAQVDMKVNAFKPYLGFGFGRAVPKNSRVTVSCDFGVQFWGSPGAYAEAKKGGYFAEKEYQQIKYSDLGPEDDKDLKDALEWVEKFPIYPVLNIRVTGRIF